MKKQMKIIGMAGALIAASGCANVRQSASVVAWNPVTQHEETRITTADITTLFTAKQVVQNLTASNTSKSQKLGAVAIDQQTSMAELIELITKLAPLIAAAQTQQAQPFQSPPPKVQTPQPIYPSSGQVLVPGP